MDGVRQVTCMRDFEYGNLRYDLELATHIDEHTYSDSTTLTTFMYDYTSEFE